MYITKNILKRMFLDRPLKELLSGTTVKRIIEGNSILKTVHDSYKTVAFYF